MDKKITKPLTGLTAVWVTQWAWPFGGGEAFFYQCARWASELGMKVFWLAFSSADNRIFTVLKQHEMSCGAIRINVPGGFSDIKLMMWLRFLKPDVVHHQGSLRTRVLRVCKISHIPMVTGFHFWSGGVNLDESRGNVDILENVQLHKKSGELDEVLRDADVVYLASEFMRQVFEMVTHVSIPHVLTPIPGRQDCVNDVEKNAWNRQFVTLMNIHKLKGGEIILHLIKKLKHIPFYVAKTEHASERLDEEIKKAIAAREYDSTAVRCVFAYHDPDVKKIYGQTRILLVPSLVDETFCRVAYEGLLNGIPVITTGKGNIKNILGDAGVYLSPNDHDEWARWVNNLYMDQKRYEEQANKMKQRLTMVPSEEEVKRQFSDLLSLSISNHYKKEVVMIYTPWCDQGLGYQSRNYAEILKNKGFQTCIFAFAPYWKSPEYFLNQAKPSEWYHENVYYSGNNREAVTDEELMMFVNRYGVTKCIIPETCWSRIFQVASLMRELGVKCIGVPNIETVRRSEVSRHKFFNKILCNNRFCETHFRNFGFENVEYVGYSIPSNFIRPHVGDDEPVRFLFLGGMNAFSRKQVLKVMMAFDQATLDIPPGSAHLTACVQSCTEHQMNLLRPYTLRKDITVIMKHQSGEEINNQYLQSHVVIQVSHHEGLGLGFFEAVSKGLPVITLAAFPHKEIIIHEKNGYVLPCTYRTMHDNNDALYESAHFEISDLAKAIVKMVTDRQFLNSLFEKTEEDYKERFDMLDFENRFCSAIYNC